VELCRLMKIANAELDTADAGNPAVRHGRDLLPSPGPRIAQSGAKSQSGAVPTALNKTPIRVARALASPRSRTAPASAAPPRASSGQGTDKGAGNSLRAHPPAVRSRRARAAAFRR